MEINNVRLFSNMDVRTYEPPTIRRAQVLSEAKTTIAGKTVFLSHSSVDDAIVPAVISFFASFEASVYADDFDKRLPNPPSAITASILKSEIRKCPRFVVLTTPSSRTSRWIPWELGLADGYKGIPPNATLMFTPEGIVETWTKEQYFNLYPKIVNDNWNWVVTDPRGSATWPLKQWLHTPLL
jgi:hypothetical protein